MTNRLAYPNESLWSFLQRDEPDPADDWHGDTEQLPTPLESVIADLDAEDVDWKDLDHGGH